MDFWFFTPKDEELSPIILFHCFVSQYQSKLMLIWIHNQALRDKNKF